MSGLGRGRGRGRGVFRADADDAAAATKPGGGGAGDTKDDNVPAVPTIDINQLSTLVQSLSLEADDISKDMVANAVMKYADSESHVEEILRILYIRILLDWKYARHMAYICAKLVKIPNLGMKFRASLVRRIQSDFNNRETDREEKPRTFLGCMAFLCQVLHQLRNTDREPFRPLVTPVYRGLEMLLDSKATDKEMEVGATQLKDVGPLLQKFDEKEMIKLMKTVREKILDTASSREIREMMLNVLETYAGGWKPPKEYEDEDKTPSAQGDADAKSQSPKQASPKHASPKRVSFKDVTDVTTVSSSGYQTKPTYTTATTDDYPDDFGGVWENPPTDNGNAKTFSYNWSSPPVTPEKNDNDAGQWEYPPPGGGKWE